MAMAEMANHATKEPWPPLETAAYWFDRAGFVLIGALVVGAFATAAIVWLGIVKEHHWDLAREKSGLEIATTQGEAARANEAAGKAHERAAALEADAAKARVELSKANAAIAAANERTAEAQRKTAEIERQTTQMREKLANRRVTAGQHAILNKALSAHKATVDFVSMGDPESVLLAADFIRAFELAGWTIGKKELPLHEHWIGLILYQSDDPATNVIALALTAAEIPFVFANAPKKERATIIVGGRPPFF